MIKCNPANHEKGGLHGPTIKMGILQSHLPALKERIQGGQTGNPGRVLPCVRL
jgi:hypothetical protein